MAPCLKDCASNHVKEKKKKIDFPYFPKERSTEEEEICGFRLSAERVSVMTPLAFGCGLFVHLEVDRLKRHPPLSFDRNQYFFVI